MLEGDRDCYNIHIYRCAYNNNNIIHAGSRQTVYLGQTSIRTKCTPASLHTQFSQVTSVSIKLHASHMDDDDNNDDYMKIIMTKMMMRSYPNVY